MKPEKQRIAIAQACGFERIILDYESTEKRRGFALGSDGIWRTPSANKWLRCLKEQDVRHVGEYFVEVWTGKVFADFDGPDSGGYGRGNFDYLNDLNDMHDAERKKLYGKWREVYTKNLELVIRGYARKESWLGHNVYLVAHATAAQRAEAFLKTIGKWKEDL